MSFWVFSGKLTRLSKAAKKRLNEWDLKRVRVTKTLYEKTWQMKTDYMQNAHGRSVV